MDRPDHAAWAEVPLPPSANALHLAIPGRVKRPRTPRYSRWLRQAGLIVNASSLGKFAEKTPLGVFIEADISRRRDLDNIVKPILDLLQHVDVIVDDRWVDRISVARRARGMGSERALVSVCEMEHET